MSFLPPISSSNRPEPLRPIEVPPPSKPSILNQLRNHVVYNLQPTILYQTWERFWGGDSVTQVAIRSRFDARLAKEWQRLAGKQQPLSLILCEIDGFNQYRKHHGDLACNHCLSQVLRVISANIERPANLVARYQGDMFVILLPQTSLDEAACLAKKVRLRVKALKLADQHQPIGSDPISAVHSVTISLGVGTLLPSSQWSPLNLIASAEASLRQAQATGGNRAILQEGGA
ncbi:MAG: diguanylate cyclase [Acaryochloridaceae cyanobacterium SU_2_1]|nr:diguanylate cyclase [Acaryochloridaceae cyanobacterium SU_2_1]NJM95684.1 diguanylate cyclase [Acaryochloridaceae cyanobacterium CSU_5_19]